MHGGASISSSHLDGEGARSKIWGQAVQYIDEVPVEAVSLHTDLRDRAPAIGLPKVGGHALQIHIWHCRYANFSLI